MLKNKNIVSVLLIFAFTVCVVIFFNINNYVENEGFNPTDEGAVLAQSWRINNGEVPHKDFISVRPAGSGYLHLIDLILPGSLLVASRWFVIFQYFIISLVISLFFFKEISKKFKLQGSPLVLLSMVIAGFSLCLLNYNLFSSATIDAVFWACLSLPLIFSEKNKFKNIIGLILLSFAALSQQTFFIISILGNIYMIYVYRKEFKKVIPVLLLGALPYFAYSLLTISYGVFGDFIRQITSGNDFFSTLILKDGRSLYKGLSGPFNFLVAFISFLLIIRRKYDFTGMLVKRGIHAIIVIIYLIFSVGLIIRHFLLDHIDIYEMPIELLFIFLFFIIFHFALLPASTRIRLISISTYLIAWMSAVSTEVNTPVFSVGIMFLSILFLSADILLEYPFEKVKFIKNKYLILIVSIAIFIFGHYSQGKVNYRDDPKDRLVSGLNEVSPGFGNIKTNAFMFGYYKDLKDIYESLDNNVDNVVVFPCNAVFYPLMETRNPMSLDRFTDLEYHKPDYRITKDLKELIDNREVYFIVDKIDVKNINKKIIQVNYNKDPLYSIIKEKCSAIEVNSDFFEVYKSF